MTIGSFQMTHIWHKFVVSFIQHHVISRFKIMNFCIIRIFYVLQWLRHLPCFNERKNEQTNMHGCHEKKKFTTFGVYFVMSLCAPAFVKGQVEKSMIFHFGTLQNRNWRQHIKFLQKLRQSMYSWWRFNHCNTSATERKTTLIVIPGRFFPREPDWVVKPQKRAKALARLYYLAQPKQPKPPCHTG